MHLLRTAALAGLIATAAGCASNPFPARALTAAQLADASHGVVLVSTGGVQRCMSLGQWGPVYNARNRKPAPGSPIVAIDSVAESDFADHYGTLSALALPPGRYAISVQYANPQFDSTGKPPAAAFDVVAGQVTYIGELWRITPCTSVSAVVVRDQYDRDVALATRLNPAFGARAPAKALADWVH